MSKPDKLSENPTLDSDLASGVIRLKPQEFIHVLDNNTGITRLEVGPQTITLRDGERLILKPQPAIVVPPRHYCIVANPVMVDENGAPLTDPRGQIKLRYGDQEIRLSQEPFPLYPGEELAESVTQLQVVETNQALRLRALRDFSATLNQSPGKPLKPK